MRRSTCTERRPKRHRRALVAAALAGASVLAACTIPTDADTDVDAGPSEAQPEQVTTDAPAPVPQQDDEAVVAKEQRFTAEFAEFSAGLPGSAAIAVAAVGPDGQQEVLAAGDPSAPVAWSTIKVPLARAALDIDPGAGADAYAAITVSDNPAAEALWARFAGPDAAAAAVEAQIVGAGAPVPQVPTVAMRDGFSIFGQTVWPLADQARYAAATVCADPDDPVTAMMGEIAPGQSWGLGTVPGARFKGGWGPEPGGAYLARQFGVIDTEIGPVAVAIAAIADAGDFDSATVLTTRVTDWLVDRTALLPGPSC